MSSLTAINFRLLKVCSLDLQGPTRRIVYVIVTAEGMVVKAREGVGRPNGKASLDVGSLQELRQTRPVSHQGNDPPQVILAAELVGLVEEDSVHVRIEQPHGSLHDHSIVIARVGIDAAPDRDTMAAAQFPVGADVMAIPVPLGLRQRAILVVDVVPRWPMRGLSVIQGHSGPPSGVGKPGFVQEDASPELVDRSYKTRTVRTRITLRGLPFAIWNSKSL